MTHKRILKINVLKYLHKHTYVETTKEFGISKSTIINWRADKKLHKEAMQDDSAIITNNGHSGQTEIVNSSIVENYLSELLSALQVEVPEMSHNDMIKYATLLKAIISEKTFSEKKKHQSVLQELLERHEREGNKKPMA